MSRLAHPGGSHHAYPTWMLAWSSEPLKKSEPGRAPITTDAVLAIDPTEAASEKVCPSTTSLIAEDVFTQRTTCHWPFVQRWSRDQLAVAGRTFEAARGLPGGLVLHLELSPAGLEEAFPDQVPVRQRGDLVALRCMLIVMFALPGFRSPAEGTAT